VARVLTMRRRHGRCAHHDELTHLRRDLHDGLGPSLAGIMIRADLLAQLVSEDPTAERLVRELRREAASFLAEFRRALAGREPTELAGRDLAGGLSELAARFSDVLTVELDVDLPATERDVQVAAFWIVKEALTNVAKHARATNCVVRVRRGLYVSIMDNGVGGLRDNGVGLTSMRDRAEELGGWCEVTDTGAGVTVTAHLPAERHRDDAACA
jgi:two-component system NarL family sensor kinase